MSGVLRITQAGSVDHWDQAVAVAGARGGEILSLERKWRCDGRESRLGDDARFLVWFGPRVSINQDTLLWKRQVWEGSSTPVSLPSRGAGWAVQ